MSEKLIHKFNYKGYIIIIAEKDGAEWIYPIHETYDLENDSTPTCLSVEDCIQWIDEDVKCRAEENDRQKRAGLNPEAIANMLLEDMDGYGQNILEMLTWYMTKRPECLREWQDWFLGKDMDFPKKCFNHCPKCDAGENEIDWGAKDWCDNQAYQSAVCKKCGCSFKEYYTYTDTEIDGEK